jgi:hypothetical protein
MAASAVLDEKWVGLGGRECPEDERPREEDKISAAQPALVGLPINRLRDGG